MSRLHRPTFLPSPCSRRIACQHIRFHSYIRFSAQLMRFLSSYSHARSRPLMSSTQSEKRSREKIPPWICRGRIEQHFHPESPKTQRSQAASSSVVSNVPEEVDPGKVLEFPDQTGNMSEERKSRVIAEEAKFREMRWETFRVALGRFTDEGDVQMCSHVFCIGT